MFLWSEQLTGVNQFGEDERAPAKPEIHFEELIGQLEDGEGVFSQRQSRF